MAPAELLEAIETICLSERRLGELTHYSPGAVRNWVLGKARVPPDVAAWLRRRFRDWNNDPPPPRYV